MRHRVVLFIHLLAILVRLLGPGGVRSIVAESLLLKHQLLLLNRSRQRSPIYAHGTAFLLRGSDRFIAAGCVPKVRLNSVSQSDYR